MITSVQVSNVVRGRRRRLKQKRKKKYSSKVDKLRNGLYKDFVCFGEILN